MEGNQVMGGCMRKGVMEAEVLKASKKYMMKQRLGWHVTWPLQQTNG